MQLRDTHFLVVDDHQPMRQILRSLLYGLGARQVSDAEDAARAFELLRHTPVDLLLTDYDMGGETGVQLAQRLRRTAGLSTRRIPIIMVTGRAEGPVIRAARDAGVDEYLVKPLTAASLCQKVEAVLGRRRPFIDTPAYVGPDRRRQAGDYAGAERRSATAALVQTA
jgi:CheY-like chemotaxis protein